MEARVKEIERREKANKPPKSEEEQEQDEKSTKERHRAKAFSDAQLDSAFNATTDSTSRAQYRLELGRRMGFKKPKGESSDDSPGTKAYHKAQNTDDAKAELRVRAYKGKLNPIDEAYHTAGGSIGKGGWKADSKKAKDGLVDHAKLKQIEQEHENELHALRDIAIYEARLKEFKKRLLKGEDPEKVMDDIRKEQAELFKYLEKRLGQ